MNSKQAETPVSLLSSQMDATTLAPRDEAGSPAAMAVPPASDGTSPSRVLVVTHHIPYTCHLVTPNLPRRTNSALQRATSRRYLNAASFKDYNNFVQYGGSNLISSANGTLGASPGGAAPPGGPLAEEDEAVTAQATSSAASSPMAQTPDRSISGSPRPQELISHESLLQSLSGKSGDETAADPVASPDREPADEKSAVAWKFSTRRGHSAMYSGIRSLSPEERVLVIGYTGTVFDDAENALEYASLDGAVKASLAAQLERNLHCYPVFMDEKTASGHYDHYCKTDLWPLFHYIQWDNSGGSGKDRNRWDDYVAANVAYADAVAAVYRSGDVVWIHDYHLMLVPSLVRERCPNAEVAFFLHTPFPSSELFRCLPKRKEILHGLLGADLIGFQTYSYARHFTSSCTRVLGLESNPKGVDYNGSIVQVGIYPIGIDVARVQIRRQSPSVLQKIAALRESYAGKRIIIGRDKLDYIKGVQHKLCAFEKFLATHPEWRNRVMLVQVTSPAALRSSAHLESKVSEIVSRINSQFGSLEFTPVRHFHQNLDQDEYCALLSTADVGLITSVRDGMNTTSHEFVVCQHENRGVLILSEFTGTAGSLSAALLVNPFDYVGVAGAIKEALEMSREEKFNKHQQLYDHVTRHTAQFWARSFVKDLRQVVRSPDAARPTPSLNESTFFERYARAQSRLLLFDYDGTLTPIVKTPGAAHPGQRMLDALAILARDPKNHVFVISGRDQAALDQWLGGIAGLGFSAEHGCFIKYPDEPNWINLSEDLDFSWKADVAAIFEYYTERTQGSSVEQKRSSITWHYRLADPEFGIFQAKECQNHLENAILSKRPVEILVGKKCLEVRPVSINKGEIVKRLWSQRLGVTDFVFCVGDDKTDEDMFKMVHKLQSSTAGASSVGSPPSTLPPSGNALRPEESVSGPSTPQPCHLGDDAANPVDAFTCTIGPANKKTHAMYHLGTPHALIDDLQRLAAISQRDMATDAPLL